MGVLGKQCLLRFKFFTLLLQLCLDLDRASSGFLGFLEFLCNTLFLNSLCRRILSHLFPELALLLSRL